MSNNNWESLEKEMRQRSEIPQKYKDMLQNVLTQMESETGNMYQFTVNRFGNPSNYNCVVGEFKTRNKKVEVYEMDTDHKELEGIYDSINDIINKLSELRKSEAYVMSEGVKATKSLLGAYYEYGMHQNNQKWTGIRVSEHDDAIYYAAGGSLSICEPRGKYRFV